MVLTFSTGIRALDEILHGVQPGDNVVFQVEKIEDYIPFVHSFVRDALQTNHKLIYFRFAEHKPLLPPDIQAEVFNLHPDQGFEHFIDEIFMIIEKFGKGACYVFDSLSELAVDWYSDRMLANFFMLTCPYLYDFETETYFGIIKNHHSHYTINSIHNTAQIILDVYNKDGVVYLHPLKVWKRHSPTMYMIHKLIDNKFIPILMSAQISEVISDYSQPWVDFTTKIQDVWSYAFSSAYRILEDYHKGFMQDRDVQFMVNELIQMSIIRDEPLIQKVRQYFSLNDLVKIGRRMIGTGLIGGKSVGMLLAQAILKSADPQLAEKLEKHDSFYIGSDVFYSYLVINKAWWKRYKIRKSKNFLELSEDARKSLDKGIFPEDIVEQFRNMLAYYGQSPIIVRSSSLLEDAYGNSFSGKYESIFLANQGTPEERLEQFMEAVREVYKSTLSDSALSYRSKRNLLDKDEQMAILVQRVSGSIYGNYFYPQLAGVGYSYNPFVWSKDIEPKAGLIRIVFGLGTRAVDRIDDDYTRIVALNAPEKRPESSRKEKRQINQRKVDLLDLKQNKFKTLYFDDVVKESVGLPLDLFAERDWEAEDYNRQYGKASSQFYYLDLDKKILKSPVIKDMQKILMILHHAYNYPVDIEFTINYTDQNRYLINLLQCRPFQVYSGSDVVEAPKDIKDEDIILTSHGPIIGTGIAKKIDRIIYVVPEIYGNLPISERYSVARTIGLINQLQRNEEKTTFLLGPGRWATTSPELGVPVKFQEINNISVICEITEMHEYLTPDASLGTHFFNDLVESKMIYIAVLPQQKDVKLNKKMLNELPNCLPIILPEAEKYANVIRVIDTPSNDESRGIIKIYSNPVNQYAVLYLCKK